MTWLLQVPSGPPGPLDAQGANVVAPGPEHDGAASCSRPGSQTASQRQQRPAEAPLSAVCPWRALIGATDPADAPPGTIRGDFCVEVSRNVIHGSDSVESARREIALWFGANELLCWEDSAGHWLYE
ncbi:PREDICTED: nucleoside diphosphate kinase 3 [Galeopterus variegatus]|uniref:Nucleoside diphosphate kinase n=1 Tax=Galeopterus variegatus TaxID=482537 RepID=A0ABM0RHT2_GALVR|nr:PREDICTED: nucleoside diphosphate kinase 3 [Galeopterus variegatus]